MNNVGNKITELRKQNNYTQTYIAETVLKMNRSNYGKYEKGKLELNNYMLITLANFYEVTTDYILGLEDDNGQKIK